MDERTLNLFCLFCFLPPFDIKTQWLTTHLTPLSTTQGQVISSLRNCAFSQELCRAFCQLGYKLKSWSGSKACDRTKIVPLPGLGNQQDWGARALRFAFTSSASSSFKIIKKKVIHIIDFWMIFKLQATALHKKHVGVRAGLACVSILTFTRKNSTVL